MKKLLSSLFTLLIFLSSCEPKQDLTPINNLEAEISFLKEMNRVGLNLAVSHLAKFITQGERNEIRLNQRELVRGILSGLNGPFFQTNEKLILDLSNQSGDSSLPSIQVNLRETGFVDLSTFGVYSEDQLNLVQPFVNDLLNNDDISLGKSRTIEFQLTIVNSSLSYDEKFQLLAFNAGVISLIEFLENGGVEDIRIILAQEIGFNGAFDRLTGCSISTRSIFADGVVGLVGGAAGGCYAGATAGTVAFPLVGTVTGCVGAGVVGGAGGFLSGIAYGIASQLLTSCFR
jgi:hypothetical protein